MADAEKRRKNHQRNVNQNAKMCEKMQKQLQ